MNGTRRTMGKEITDDLSLSDPEIIKNLREIESINKLFGGYGTSLSGIKDLIAGETSREISIADYGCGTGGSILYLKNKLSGKTSFDFYGIEANKNVAVFAGKRFRNLSGVHIIHSNFFAPEIRKRKFDIIHSSLTCHHFEDYKLVELFKQLLHQCKFGFVINDLHRHCLALAGVKILNLTLIKTKIGKHDGVQSVLRGFTRKELASLLNKAGVKQYTIKWKWAFRWLVVAKK